VLDRRIEWVRSVGIDRDSCPSKESKGSRSATCYEILYHRIIHCQVIILLWLLFPFPSVILQFNNITYLASSPPSSRHKIRTVLLLSIIIIITIINKYCYTYPTTRPHDPLARPPNRRYGPDTVWIATVVWLIPIFQVPPPPPHKKTHHSQEKRSDPICMFVVFFLNTREHT